MFALFVATLLIAAWSNKDRSIDATKDTIASKVDPSAKQLLVQDHILGKRSID